MKKKYIIYIIAIFGVLFSYQFIGEKNKLKLDYWLDDNIFYRLNAAKRIIFYKKKFSDSFHNNYNQNYLPNTQFQKLSLKKYRLNFLPRNEDSKNFSFFIEIIENKNILTIDSKGNFYLIENLYKNELKAKDVIKIKNNLIIHKTLDTFLYKNKLFISYINLENKCKTFKIAYADFNLKYLDFTNFFSGKECKKGIGGGRMQNYVFNNTNGIIFSLSSDIQNFPTNEPQEESSIYGKILFKNFNLSELKIFSKGHRTTQGLIVTDDVILSTEHGPKGGDEINKIKYSKNYGWPIASYGGKYGKNDMIPSYDLDHSKLGFIEPIYAFVPSIGISEIIKLPNNFSNHWKENFIITSLNRGSIYRVKFDKNFEKLIYKEEIFIGKRIRDIKYFSKKKLILLALESRGELGVLSTQ